MSDYRHGSHTTFSIHLHTVWITKYRHKALRGEVAERVRAIVREACRKLGVDILPRHIAPDHIHVMVSLPPQVTISRLIQQMKGKSSYRLRAEFPHLRKRFWGRHVWARGSCWRSSGQVTDEVIKAYIAQQDQASDDVFRIEGETASAEDAPPGTPRKGASPSPSARLSRNRRGLSRNRRLESFIRSLRL
jgi:putative transposase